MLRRFVRHATTKALAPTGALVVTCVERIEILLASY